jgi:hypothetical protein
LQDINLSVVIDHSANSEQKVWSSENRHLRRKAVRDTPLINRKILIQIGENPHKLGSRRTSAPLRNANIL